MFKKIKTATLGLVSGLIMFGGGVTVFANNHTDRAWGGDLPVLQGNHYTYSYTKTDTTPAYIKLNTIGEGGINAYLQLHDGTHVNSPKVNVKQGEHKYVHSDAFENYGEVDVRMSIESDYLNVVKVEAHGVWSPDSYQGK